MKTKRTSPTDAEEQLQQAEMFDSGEVLGLFDISEVWVYFDVDGDGVPVDLFLTVSMEAGVILKEQYNSLGTRFITNAKYVSRPRALSGRGTGQMTEGVQTEVTSLHNLRIDNAKLANMRMILTKRNSGFGGQREVYPGAVWEVENPAEDVRSFQLGEVYPSSLQAETHSLQYGMRSVGLSESQMGFADSTLGSRDTARGQAMRLQTGDTILGSVVEGLKTALGRVGLLVWMQCVANKERVIARETIAKRLPDADLEILKEALNVPIGEVPMRLSFTVRTTDADRTYEQQRMNLMSLSQLFAQFGQQSVPLAMQLFGPQGQQMKQAAPEMWAYMARLLTGSTKLMEQIFTFMGIPDTGNYLPDGDRLDKMTDMMQGMMTALQGAPQQPGGAVGQGMPDVMAQQGGECGYGRNGVMLIHGVPVDEEMVRSFQEFAPKTPGAELLRRAAAIVEVKAEETLRSVSASEKEIRHAQGQRDAIDAIWKILNAAISMEIGEWKGDEIEEELMGDETLGMMEADDVRF
ncbi:MAG: hypothetical protein HC888_03690 [Candidatus Competibacteraceae bacterium]|nr:hypothetical protein [Candidatus Competibacteraceae bacterium]